MAEAVLASPVGGVSFDIEPVELWEPAPCVPDVLGGVCGLVAPELLAAPVGELLCAPIGDDPAAGWLCA